MLLRCSYICPKRRVLLVVEMAGILVWLLQMHLYKTNSKKREQQDLLRTDPDYQLQISVPSETRPRAHFALASPAGVFRGDRISSLKTPAGEANFACTEVLFWSQKFRAPSFAPQGRMTLLNVQQVYPFVALQVLSERTIWRLVCRSWFYKYTP